MSTPDSAEPPALDAARVLSQRYGRRRRWPVVLFATIVSVVFLSWLAWTTSYHATPQVSSQLISFDVVDEHSVRARVSVDVADGITGDCRIRAIAADHTVVGEVGFDVTSADNSAPVERTIRTERRATTVERLGCTAPDQIRRR